MPVLKYQRSRQLLRNSRPSKRASRLLLLICVLLSLVLVTTLTGCAANSKSLSAEPRPTPIESVIDVSDWRQKVSDYCKKLDELLSSAKRTISDLPSK